MSEKKAAKYILLLSLSAFIFFSLRVIISDDVTKAEYIGDDSYYYLNLARNFFEQGNWSFDKYGTPATGLHLLNAYFVFVVYSVFGENALTVLPFIYLLISLSIIFFVIKNLKKDSIAILIVAVLISSFATYINVVSFMEWLWVVLFSILIFRNFPDVSARKLFFLGLGGTLARSDFVIFLSAFFLYAVFKRRENVLKSFAMISGGALGVAIYTFHNYWISGSFLQSSAEIKLHRSLLLGVNPFPFWLQTLRNFIGFPRLNLFDNREARILFYNIALVLLVLLSLIIIAYALRNRRAVYERLFPLFQKQEFAISLIILFFYSLFYSFNSFGMQIWYSAVMIVPLSIIIYHLLLALKKEHAVLLLSSVVLFNLFVSVFMKPFNYEQKNAVEYAECLNNNFETDKYIFGAWDSGIVGYYLNSRVVNLDGLVNSEIVPYLKSDRLIDYLKKKKIDFLLQTPPDKSEYYGFDKKEMSALLTKMKIGNSGNCFVYKFNSNK